MYHFFCLLVNKGVVDVGIWKIPPAFAGLGISTWSCSSLDDAKTFDHILRPQLECPTPSNWKIQSDKCRTGEMKSPIWIPIFRKGCWLKVIIGCLLRKTHTHTHSPLNRFLWNQCNLCFASGLLFPNGLFPPERSLCNATESCEPLSPPLSR